MRSGDERMTLPRLSLHRKLILLSLAATVLGLTMASLGLALYERHTFRSDRANELALLANTLGANAAASMVFNDSATAGDILEAVRADHGIIAARLYDTRGRIFAEYVRAEPSTELHNPATSSRRSGIPLGLGRSHASGVATWRKGRLHRSGIRPA